MWVRRLAGAVGVARRQRMRGRILRTPLITALRADVFLPARGERDGQGDTNHQHEKECAYGFHVFLSLLND
jgi:hypothetical protein